MAEQTGISWADSTFNPWIGCTKVGPGCDHCYAEAMFDKRMGKVVWGSGQPRQRTSGVNWGKPSTWNAKPFFECTRCGMRGNARAMGDSPKACQHLLTKPARRRVFCASLADVFDNEVDPAWRDELFVLIDRTPNLDWLLLTKRIGNARAMTRGGCPPNVWLGATICNQDEADRDVQKLLGVPADIRFLSIEPMLGPLWLRDGWIAAPRSSQSPVVKAPIDWVIAGGESGRNARPMHPDWVRSLRDQCAAAGVPFHFKQWGGASATAGGCALDGVKHKAWPGNTKETR